MPTTAEAVAEYFAAIRAMDVDRWVAVFAPDAISNDPVGAPPMVGQDALHAFITHITTAFRKISLTEDHVYVCGTSAAVPWTGFAETHAGKRVDFDGVDVIDCNDEGKIILVRAFWDPAPVFAALNG
jgi:steroid delta-isomerase